jgi:hypothetical protein
MHIPAASRAQAARLGAIAAPFMLMLGSMLALGSPSFLP